MTTENDTQVNNEGNTNEQETSFEDSFNESVGLTEIGKPESEVKPEVKSEVKTEVKTEVKPEPKPIVETPAKDTVDYKDLLEKERHKVNSISGRLSAADKRTNELESKLKEIKEGVIDGTVIDENDPLIKAFITEMGDDFIKPLNAYVNILLKKAIEPFKEKIEKVPLIVENITDIKSTHADQHYSTILGAHPDVAELLETGAIDSFVEDLPYKEAIKAKDILAKGNAKQVVDFLNVFKEKTGKVKTESNTKTTETVIDPKKITAATAVRGGISVLPKGKVPVDDFEGAFKEAVAN